MDGDVACDQGINGPNTLTVGADCGLSSSAIGNDNCRAAQKFTIDCIADLALGSVGDRLARRRELTL